MFRNYLKIAFRNMSKHKMFTSMNILSLSIGLALCILTIITVKFHLGFDDYHQENSQIYRVVTDFNYPEGAKHSAGIPSPIGEALRTDYPAINKIGLLRGFDDIQIDVQENGQTTERFRENGKIAFAEPSFFEIFNYKAINGDPINTLLAPNMAVITEKYAKKYFRDKNPIGKTIILDNRQGVKVVGLLKDIPENTDFRYEVFISYKTLDTFSPEFLDNWSIVNSSTFCFLKFSPNQDVAAFNESLVRFVKKYHGANRKEYNHKLQPLNDVHFNPNYGGYADKTLLWALLSIGVFLLLIACCNFINLVTAQSFKRAKEIGVRKVFGGTQQTIFWQFIAETAFTVILSVVLSVVIIKLLIPSLNEIILSQLSFNIFQDLNLLLLLIALTLIMIVLAGFYPAVVLSGFSPILALKGKVVEKSSGKISIRKGLVIFQFTISQLLILGTLVIALQINHIRNTDLGFEKENIVLIPIPSQSEEKLQSLKKQLQAITQIKDVSFSIAPPASAFNNFNTFHFYGENTIDGTQIFARHADSDYLKTYNLHLVAGRNLAESDTVKEYLVNEAFLKTNNIDNPEEVIGKLLEVNSRRYPIVGVVKNFHLQSAHKAIKPCFITSNAQMYRYAGIKINMADSKQLIPTIKKTWNTVFPESVFEYDYLDNQISNFYIVEDTILKLINFFTAIAIVLSCLGIYGLISYIVNQRKKEIAIRKISGASVFRILWLFFDDFFRLIALAFAIAAPIAWFGMSAWLQDFSLRIELGFELFVMTLFLMVILTIIVISYQSTKAAINKPINALKAE
jgi:putative ABC transport system permease protein